MFQRTYLKDIRIVPTLTQCGMGKDKPYRIVKRQQNFLVFEDKVISGNIIAFIFATLEGTVYFRPFLVNADISCMRAFRFNIAELLFLGGLEQCKVFIENSGIFLFKDFTVLGIDFVAVLVITAVLCHFVNEKQ